MCIYSDDQKTPINKDITSSMFHHLLSLSSNSLIEKTLLKSLVKVVPTINLNKDDGRKGGGKKGKK